MPKKYLVLTELFLPTKGGTAVWFAEVYSRLGGKGIHIVTAAVPGCERVDAQHPNSVHRLSLSRVPWLKPESLLMYLRFLGCSLRLAITRRFDAIHAGRALPEGLVAWLTARLTGHRVVIYAHGEELTGWGRGWKYRAMCFALRHADTVIANSDFTRDTLVAMGVPSVRIMQINPGVDVERFRPGLDCADLRQAIGIGPDQKIILSVGRLQARKGFDTTIRALELIRQSGVDAHYVLIGIGEQMDELRALCADLGMTRYVHFLGHVPTEDLARWYNACDVFAMPNREVAGDTEGFGMVFLEAAACGKPVIAGRAGGTGSAVVDGETGVRVDGDSLREVVDSLICLLKNDDYAEELAQRGLKRAREQFSWQAIASRTAAI